MINIFEKRGRWCYRDANGKLCKFSTEAEAKSSLGLEIVENAEKEIETQNSEEETYTDEQETLCDGEGTDEEEI